jgi:hypothetical protein
MLVAEKDGITFFLVEKRFTQFEEMALAVKNVFDRNLGKSTVIVFPEITMGENAVPRAQTKEWLRTVQALAKQHGNGYIFLSLLEQVPAKKTVTNTGYLVGPEALNPESKKPMHWKAYAKRTMPTLDASQLYQGPEPIQAMAHWNRRAGRNARENPLAEEVEFLQWTRHVFKFPRIKINGKIVELRVCADISAFNHSPVDILIVPACGLIPMADAHKQRVLQALTRRGFAIINDVFPLWSNNQIGIMGRRRRFVDALKQRRIRRRLN